MRIFGSVFSCQIFSQRLPHVYQVFIWLQCTGCNVVQNIKIYIIDTIHHSFMWIVSNVKFFFKNWDGCISMFPWEPWLHVHEDIDHLLYIFGPHNERWSIEDETHEEEEQQRHIGMVTTGRCPAVSVITGASRSDVAHQRLTNHQKWDGVRQG